jgi:hypothetical protein
MARYTQKKKKTKKKKLKKNKSLKGNVLFTLLGRRQSGGLAMMVRITPRWSISSADVEMLALRTPTSNRKVSNHTHPRIRNQYGDINDINNQKKQKTTKKKVQNRITESLILLRYHRSR